MAASPLIGLAMSYGGWGIALNRYCTRTRGEEEGAEVYHVRKGFSLIFIMLCGVDCRIDDDGAAPDDVGVSEIGMRAREVVVWLCVGV